MLERVIAEAEAIYIAKADALDKLQMNLYPGRLKTPFATKTLPTVNEQSIRLWLSRIIHQPTGRHRRIRRLATAYYRAQRIVYNPLYISRCISSADEDSLLDTVLHEFGHLFTFHFFWEKGHGIPWRRVGTVVGYAEVGTAWDHEREKYDSYAAHKGSFSVPDSPMGKIDETVTFNKSKAPSPVKLVWQICDKYPNHPRSEIVALCILAGVNPNTASTQYSHWKKDRKLRAMFGDK